MEIIGPLQVGLGGMLGAVLVEAVRLVKRLRSGRIPKHPWRYALASVLLILIGSAVAVIHADQVMTLLVAAQLGAVGPALVGAWVSSPISRGTTRGVAPRIEKNDSGDSFMDDFKW